MSGVAVTSEIPVLMEAMVGLVKSERFRSNERPYLKKMSREMKEEEASSFYTNVCTYAHIWTCTHACHTFTNRQPT